MNMVTTRGCPFHCNWCAKPIWGQRYNVRSPENVVAELKWLKETYRPDHIWYVDDILGLKPGWLPRLADLLEKERASLPFKCLSRVDLLLREGEVEALKRAGCQIVWVGAESGSQKILDSMEKGTRVEQIYEAARRLQAIGVQVGFFLQFGYPGEGREDINKTFQMVRDCQPDDIGMSVSYPLPGTKFYNSVKEQLGFRQNWIDSSDLAMLYQGQFSTSFYRQLHVVLHKEFRARKAWGALRIFRVSRQKSTTPTSRLSGLLKNTNVLVRNLLTLPLERWKLNHLALISHQGLKPLTSSLTQEEAAQPSPQPDL
jgi:anaerobic magnesium-protoporphyrin IX monomethyl ester cyclase